VERGGGRGQVTRADRGGGGVAVGREDGAREFFQGLRSPPPPPPPPVFFFSSRADSGDCQIRMKAAALVSAPKTVLVPARWIRAIVSENR